MNKKDLVNAVAEKAEMSKKDARVALDAVLEAVTEGLAENGKVALSGFGSWTVSERAARKGRNPQTGEEIEIPAKLTPKFKASKNMKELIAEEGNLPE